MQACDHYAAVQHWCQGVGAWQAGEWRKGRDSNPRNLAVLPASNGVQYAAMRPLRIGGLMRLRSAGLAASPRFQREPDPLGLSNPNGGRPTVSILKPFGSNPLQTDAGAPVRLTAQCAFNSTLNNLRCP